MLESVFMAVCCFVPLLCNTNVISKLIPLKAMTALEKCHPQREEY